MCEQKCVKTQRWGKGIQLQRTCACYTRSVLEGQHNVDPVGVMTQCCVDPVGVISCIDPVGITIASLYTRSVLQHFVQICIDPVGVTVPS